MAGRCGFVLCLELFSRHEYTGKTSVAVVINPSGQQGKNFSTTNEFIHFLYKDENGTLMKENREIVNADVRTFMNSAKGESGNYLRSSGKTCFYPIYVKDNNIIGFGDVCEDDFHPLSSNVVSGDIIEIYPIDADGVERKWLFGRDTVEDIIDELSVEKNKNRNEYEIIRTKTEINYKTVWNNRLHSAKQYGTNLLTKMFGKGSKVFSFPKSLYAVKECVDIACNRDMSALIIDYFAGSGTTAHAIMLTNSMTKNCNRTFILVEMGKHFYTAMMPRVKKSAYAVQPTNWMNGKPTIRDDGVSQVIKTLVLESYEDALSNIRLDTDKGEQLSALFGEEYLVRYMIDTETADSLLDIQAFRNPFQYQMKITENNEARLRPVDVVETFNYLIGLSVARQSTVDHFRASPEQDGAYEGAVRLARDDGGEYAFQQVEGTMPDGRRALIIWRTVTDDLIHSNAALDAYFTRYRINPNDREYDVIFVNGDNNLDNIRGENEQWKVVMTELEFKARMFEGDGL
ncbi:MAG: DNA methyltransferase [Christensenellales bacterium]|jgi:adenine-specific DNA-methyltransferase